MGHIVKGPKVHENPVFTFVAKDEMRAKEVRRVGFQINGKLAGVGFVSE